MDNPERRVWGERKPKGMVTLQIILVFTLTRPKTITWGHVSAFDKYLHWPCVVVSVNIYIYIHCNRMSVSVKTLDV
jgi:hypothetical protein